MGRHDSVADLTTSVKRYLTTHLEAYLVHFRWPLGPNNTYGVPVGGVQTLSDYRKGVADGSVEWVLSAVDHQVDWPALTAQLNGSRKLPKRS